MDKRENRIMSCGGSERKTYDNIKRLARLAHRLNGKIEVVYRVGKEYGFCEEDEYTEDRGVFVEVVDYD